MQLDIQYTSFVRTTDAKHEAVVKALLRQLWPTDDVFQASYTGRYCVGCEEYKDPADLDADGLCPIHKTPCPERDEVRALRACLSGLHAHTLAHTGAEDHLSIRCVLRR